MKARRGWYKLRKILLPITSTTLGHGFGCAELHDQVLHRKRVEALVCNLAHAVLVPPPTGRIAVQLGHRRKGHSRYDSPILGKPLSSLVWMLSELDFCDLRGIPVKRGEVSSIAPSAWFARKVAEHGVQLSDFGRDEAEEVILLSRNTRATHSQSQTRSSKVYREPVDYQDTSGTRRYREDVRSLNAFLRRTDIDFVDDGLEPRIDPFDRTLRRRFMVLDGQDQRFDQGGRLFGGFWQTLKTGRHLGPAFNLVPFINIGSEPAISAAQAF